MHLQSIRFSGSKGRNPKHDQHNLEWSLKPLTVVLNLMGVPLPPSSTPHSCLNVFRRSATLLLVFCVELWLTTSACLDASGAIHSYSNGPNVLSGAITWNFIVDCLNTAVYITTGTVFLTKVTEPKKWESINRSFKMLDNNTKLTYAYVKRKREVILFVLYVFLTVIQLKGAKHSCSEQIFFLNSSNRLSCFAASS